MRCAGEQGSAKAHAAATAFLLAGLGVFFSPWFMMLQHGGTNATVSDLVVGLGQTASIATPMHWPNIWAGVR